MKSNQCNNKINQTGRSMLEILAVLLIMGMLSIAALLGFKYAMDNLKANEILNNVRLAAAVVLQHEEILVESDGSIDISEFQKTILYDMSAEQVGEEYAFAINVFEVQKGVCNAVIHRADDQYLILLDGEETTDCQDKNKMQFIFNMDETCPSNCPPERCCNKNKCCGEGQTCINGRCVDENLCDNWDTQQICGTSTCCDKDKFCCADKCCKTPFCSADQSKCCGTALLGGVETNLVPDASNPSECVCPTVNGTRLVLKNGSCECPDAGFTLVDGVCVRFNCDEGTGGNTYECYINGKLCGHFCTAEASDCENGICRQKDCVAGQPLLYHGHPGYYYGCKKEYNSDVTCYMTTKDGVYKCYRNDDNLLCARAKMNASDELYFIYGTCDDNICKAIDPNAVFMRWGDANSYNGGCLFDDNLLCTPYGTKYWTCFKNGYKCGTECTNPLNCGTCNDFECPDGLSYNTELKRCETETYYCDVTQGKWSEVCYMKSDNSRCATINSNAPEKGFAYGTCVADKCTAAGMKFAYVSEENYWGCLDENTGISCIPNYSVCYYNGKLCGNYCQLGGTECKQAYQKQCAAAGYCPQTGYLIDDCICDGQESEVDGKRYCCPEGHRYENGACTML